MIHRVAFFAEETELPEEYRKKPEANNFFVPDYNLPVGGNLRLIVAGTKPGDYTLETARWGDPGNHSKPSGLIERESFWESIKNERSKLCIVLLSGFYVWKNNREKEHPFFVRMLNRQIMTVAGVLLGDEPYANIITTGSNPLIQPMSDRMPMVMNSEQMTEWLNRKEKQDQFIQECKDPFLLTDYSVLRVSKKVNNLKNNEESLIQPIPK